MENEKPRRWQELLLTTVLAGVVIAFVQFVLVKLSKEEKELSYLIENPITYLEPQDIGNLKVEINDVPTSYLFAYRVRLWNSGDFELKNLPVLCVFNSKLKDFIVFDIRHDTRPKYEFGKILEEDPDAHSKRFTYSLLNPGDKDMITLLTNSLAQLNIYVKSEGVSVKNVKPLLKDTKITLIIVVAFALLSTVLPTLIYWVRKKLKPKEA